MRKLLWVICAAACSLAMPAAGVHPAGAQEGSLYFGASGQCTCAVSPRATSLLGQNGPALRAATAILLEREPRAADEMVCAARGGSQTQKLAIGKGIADAARFFAFCRAMPATETCRATEAYLRQAMLCADETTRMAFQEGIASDMAASDITTTTPVFIPGIGGGIIGGGVGGGAPCVSKSAPNGC